MALLLHTNKHFRYFLAASKSCISRSFNTSPLTNANNFLQENFTNCKRNISLEPLLSEIQSDVIKYGRIRKINLEKILLQLQNANDITNSQSLQIIRCCGRIAAEEPPKMRTYLAKNIWMLLIDKGLPLDVTHYNALLKVYIENEHPFSPEEFLGNMKEKGLRPNRVTLERIVWRYCQEGAIEQAREILEKVTENNMYTSEALFNALVMGHIVRDDIKAARAVLHEMALSGISPSNRTYGLLACGYAKNGDISGIENILNIAMNNDIIMTNRDLFNIIEKLALGNHEDKVEYFFSYLHMETGYEMDVYTFIYKLLDKGFESTARKIWKTMKIISFPGQNGQKIKWAYVKKIIELDLPIDKVIQTLRELQNENLIPNAVHIASRTSLSMGKSELALKLFDELQKDGVEIRQHYYWPLLARKVLEKDEVSLLELIRYMCYKNLMPSEESLRNYTIPYLLQKYTPQNIIDKLQLVNVPRVHAAFHLIIYFLETGDVNAATNVATCVQTNREPVIAQILSSAHNQSENIQLFINLFHFLISSRHQIDNGAKLTKIGDAISKLINMVNNQYFVEEILAYVVSNDIKIYLASADNIKEYLGDKITERACKLLEESSLVLQETTPEIDSLVKKYVNNILTPENNIKEAHTLIKFSRYDEALQLIQNNKCINAENIASIKKISWNILNTLADQKCEEKVKEMTNTLIANSYIEPSTVTLGALIKVHIIKDDIDGALKEFERCCLEYRVAPWSCRLMKILIMNKETSKLGRLTDLTSKIRDEESTLRDLMCMYIECGQPAEARNIIINPVLRNQIDKIFDTACRRYAEQGETNYLITMLEATKRVTCVNRQIIFYHLLVLYCEDNETDRASGLWVRMQDENEIPSARFLILLGNHLLKNGKKVPFVIPPKKSAVNRKVSDLSMKSKSISYETMLMNLEDLINNLKTAKTYKEAKDASKKLSKGIPVNIVVKDQEMFTKYQQIVVLAASRGYKLPAIFLWQELLLAGKDTEANMIFQQHLYHSDSVILGPAIKILLQRSQQRRRPEIIIHLIDVLQGVPKIVRESLGVAYSTLINMYLDDDKVGQAKAYLKLAHKNGITEDCLGCDTVERVAKLTSKSDVQSFI